jgi:hypothetical protein
MSITKSDFMAAEEIKALLTGRDKLEQERIIRWVNESLGLTQTLVATPTPHPIANPLPGQPVALTLAVPQQPATADIRSFVQQKDPKNDIHTAAVVAYFYRFQAPEAERKETLTASDLDHALRQTRGAPFKSPHTTLNNAVNQGYFDRAGRGNYKINAVGENLVAMILPGPIERNKKNARSKRTRKTGIEKNSGKEPQKRTMSAATRAKVSKKLKAAWAARKAAGK